MPARYRASYTALSSQLCCKSSALHPGFPTLASGFLRYASTSKPASKKEAAQQEAKKKREKKKKVAWKREDISKAELFPLCDAMRYIRAFEAGQSPTAVKFDLAISMRTNRSGPVIRTALRLPHMVDTSQRVAVICPSNSPIAAEALAAGASRVGEEEIFEDVKNNKIDFERLLCHEGSRDKLNKSGIARMLGPKGLMPNPKQGTVLNEVGKGIASLRGASVFRERQGVVRLAVGRLGHTPEQLQANIRALMAVVKKEADSISEQTPKQIHEVVLSSTNSPGFPLSGMLMDENSLETNQLNVV